MLTIVLRIFCAPDHRRVGKGRSRTEDGGRKVSLDRDRPHFIPIFCPHTHPPINQPTHTHAHSPSILPPPFLFPFPFLSLSLPLCPTMALSHSRDPVPAITISF